MAMQILLNYFQWLAFTQNMYYTQRPSRYFQKKIAACRVRIKNYLQPYIGFSKLIVSSIADVIIICQVYKYIN